MQGKENEGFPCTQIELILDTEKKEKFKKNCTFIIIEDKILIIYFC